MAKQSVTVVFQDPSGQPLAGGEVTFQLNFDISTATSGGPQVSAGRIVRATLDNTGSATVDLWPNDTLVPSGSVYFVTAYTAQGQPVYNDQTTVTS